jgi:hypothetical protein
MDMVVVPREVAALREASWLRPVAASRLVVVSREAAA